MKRKNLQPVLDNVEDKSSDGDSKQEGANIESGEVHSDIGSPMGSSIGVVQGETQDDEMSAASHAASTSVVSRLEEPAAAASVDTPSVGASEAVRNDRRPPNEDDSEAGFSRPAAAPHPFNVPDLYHYCMTSAERVRGLLADPKLQICSVNQISEMQYDITENYALVGVLYNITHWRHDFKDNQASGGTYGGSQFDRNRKAKREYDRMFMFADVGAKIKGTTFCYIADSAAEARSLFSYMQTESHIGIGRAFVVMNPVIVRRSRVKELMATIQFNLPLIPLSTRFNHKWPVYRMTKPSTHSCDNVFCYHNQVLKIIRHEVISNFGNKRPSCGGALCDRKKDYQTNEACGCFSIGQSNIHPVVLEYSIYMKIVELADMNYVIDRERSLRTTKLFISGLANIGAVDFSTMIEENNKLKVAINRCVEYINRNGGFTIMGTVSLGRTRDPNNAAVMIDSDVPTYHVCYLFPSNQDVICRSEYDAMMYSLEN